ncbi:MAG: hypothetical protein KJO03_04375, partial [Gammaproteobacteria bacterium]|nr:hypothetical protein [Gammaproteobacteria bacterium]
MSIIIPLIVFVFIVLIGVYEWLNYNNDKAALVNKLESLTSAYSLLLAEPVANGNVKYIKLYNTSLIADSDVAFVVIKNQEGVVLEQYGEIKGDPSLQRSVAINYSPDASISKVGEFVIGLSTKNVVSQLFDRVKYEFILLVSLVAIVLFAVRRAYIETIG